MRHVLEAKQFNPSQLDELFDHAAHMQGMSETTDDRRILAEYQSPKLMASLFYEPSTRTRLSFEFAAARLGMKVSGTENAAEFSSAAKGETLEDSIRVISSYADAIVLRHKEVGAAKRAAAVSTVPIINGGDGTGEHPTQALLDMYTIDQEKERLQDLHVVIGGDLKHGRTARSLAQLLALYPGNHISFVSPPDLGMGDDIKQYLDRHAITYAETEDMYEVLPNADVVYWTRTQTERHEHGAARQPGELEYTIGERALAAMQEDAIIMHPLPRVGEIETIVDVDPRAAYFRQAENGLFIRMALLDMVLTDV